MSHRKKAVMKMSRGRGMVARIPGKKFDKKTALRLIKYMKEFKWRILLVLFFIVLNSLTSVLSSLFLQVLIDDYITPLVYSKIPDYSGLIRAIFTMAGIYMIGVVSGYVYNRMMAQIAQGTLRNVRNDMFSHMQTLPVKYFDTNTHGDIMSHYTNDTDTLRQMLSQSVPHLFSSGISIISVFIAMLSLSAWLTGIVVLFIILVVGIIKFVGKESGKFFVKQQKSIGSLNGYIEEMIKGQKVIKVFCYEDKIKEEFDRRNEELCCNMKEANKYANILMPIMNNMGHILYAVIAIVGGALAIWNVTNVGLKGVNVLTLGMIASFLQLSRGFINPIAQLSQQFNSIIMALAGAERIFELLDEKEEEDDGYVTLVNAKKENGKLVETEEKTGIWAWKHPHKDGTLTYEEVKGRVEFNEVDFAYKKDKLVLRDVSMIAEPGQKIAFVGATGAGKTTITNLINRFYDIEDGKIRYDNININKIKKEDLRKSLGIVLQDVNLFTGTVMENIRYGRLDATDEECISAAKLANADGFINLLPNGYETVISGDGEGLSQGQRQLISIARAAVADPPVMILDEATSSIDTRTESIVQRGMDSLMKGRTVFVIAHRLSTVKNSDIIMVLDNGKIIEKGNHEELIAKKGMYYKLYMGAFELE